jgi:hypothetical protein
LRTLEGVHSGGRPVWMGVVEAGEIELSGMVSLGGLAESMVISVACLVLEGCWYDDDLVFALETGAEDLDDVVSCSLLFLLLFPHWWMMWDKIYTKASP